jgi:hypothetical protein
VRPRRCSARDCLAGNNRTTPGSAQVLAWERVWWLAFRELASGVGAGGVTGGVSGVVGVSAVSVGTGRGGSVSPVSALTGGLLSPVSIAGFSGLPSSNGVPFSGAPVFALGLGTPPEPPSAVGSSGLTASSGGRRRRRVRVFGDRLFFGRDIHPGPQQHIARVARRQRHRSER